MIANEILLLINFFNIVILITMIDRGVVKTEKVIMIMRMGNVFISFVILLKV